MNGYFVVGVLNRDVEKECKKWDGSQGRLVCVAVEKLKMRADKIETPLYGGLPIARRLNGEMRSSGWFFDSGSTERWRLARSWRWGGATILRSTRQLRSAYQIVPRWSIRWSSEMEEVEIPVGLRLFAFGQVAAA